MSEQGTLDIAELAQLESELNAAARTKPPVQLVNKSQEAPETKSQWLPVGAVIGDPNKTRAEIPHPTPVLDALRAAANNPELSEQDRASARECLRVSFHE
jgi:hypothetical protein